MSEPGGGAQHRAILALSFAPDLAPAARAAIEGRGRRALALLCGGAAPRVGVADGDLLILEAGGPGPWQLAGDGAFAFSVGMGGTDLRHGRACDGPGLLAALRAAGAAALADYGPPFAAFFRVNGQAPLEAATDACGLRHVYVTAGDGFAACASSCLALGALRDDGLDLESLAIYVRVGAHFAARTPIAGVRRLRPGERCELAGGGLRVATWLTASRPDAAFASFADAVEAGVAAMRAAVNTLAAAHEHVGLSLSGGLDSRLILAALPAERRAALEVLCIESPTSHDATLVRRLAAQAGFAPTIVDVGAFPRPRAAAWARGASLRRDHCADPFGTAVLEWAESALAGAPRLHGQNGEFARGFYYGHAAATVTREAVARILAYWLAWYRDTARLLAPAYREAAEETALTEMAAWLTALDRPWLEALDELYLEQRLAPWAGVELSRTSMRRVDLSPYCDPRFLAFARRASPEHKRGSRLLLAILEALDPALAAMPLVTSAPVANRMPPRVPTGPNQGPIGAAAVHAQLLEESGALGIDVARAAALPLFATDAIAGPDGAAAPLAPGALGFVLSVEWTLEFLEQARDHRRERSVSM